MNQTPSNAFGISSDELEKLLAQSDSSAEEKSEIILIAKGNDGLVLPQEFLAEEPPPASTAPSAQATGPLATLPRDSSEIETEQDLPPQLAKLRLPEKIKLAMFGNSTARALLIRDSNRLVQLFVLKNPRLQLREVEDFARNPNLSEQVLRHITGVAAWTKSYLVKLHLVFNPKTPSDLAMRWVQYLNHSDLRKLAKSRNVPQVLVTVARRRLEEMAQR